MITFDNDNCLIFLATHKMMRKFTYKKIRSSMEKEILKYLLGSSNTITSQIIDRFLRTNKLKNLSRNINKYIENKHLEVSEEQVLQVFFDKDTLVKFLIDLKSVSRFLKTLSIREMLTILGIRDFMKLDLSDDSFYNSMTKEKPEYYLKWKHI